VLWAVEVNADIDMTRMAAEAAKEMVRVIFIGNVFQNPANVT
jgi:hypothetical protein